MSYTRPARLLEMRINTKKRPFLSSDVDELIVPHVVDNEIFFLTKRYTLQHVIERNINCAYCTGTIRTGSCSEKVLIRKVKNVFSEAKLRTNESEQLELQMRLLRELELLRFAQHENVVKLIDTPAPTSLQTLKDVYIVSELPDTDLYSLLAFPRAKFDDKRIQSFIYQTLCALQYLHSAGIIHGNLTPENITVNKTGLVRVQGFSCARPRSSTCALDDISKSSLYFRSPEILLGYNHIDTSSDLWSLGCVIVQLLKRKVLFQGTGVLDQIERIVNLLGKPDLEDVLGTNQAVQHVISIEAPLSEGSENPFKMLLESTNPLLVDLISGLLVFNPEKRLNALQAMRHPFFMGLHREANVTWSPQEFKFDLTPEQMDPDLLKEEMYRVVKSSRILSADSLFKSAS